jgi:hypothetical protein
MSILFGIVFIIASIIGMGHGGRFRRRQVWRVWHLWRAFTPLAHSQLEVMRPGSKGSGLLISLVDFCIPYKYISVSQRKLIKGPLAEAGRISNYPAPVRC